MLIKREGAVLRLLFDYEQNRTTYALSWHQMRAVADRSVIGLAVTGDRKKMLLVSYYPEHMGRALEKLRFTLGCGVHA